MSIHVFGIRHHGPGCARSLRAALAALEPDIVLVEGPPDAQEIIPLAALPEMQPPIAILIYVPDNPRHAVYYPFTHFSPEWQALRYGFEQKIPVRFMDLPQALQLARLPNEKEDGKSEDGSAAPEDLGSATAEAGTTTPIPEIQPGSAEEQLLADDPLSLLAQAAGYTDHELWW